MTMLSQYNATAKKTRPATKPLLNGRLCTLKKRGTSPNQASRLYSREGNEQASRRPDKALSKVTLSGKNRRISTSSIMIRFPPDTNPANLAFVRLFDHEHQTVIRNPLSSLWHIA